MAPHSLGSGTISFGLVSIPVRLYTAASSAACRFNQLHGVCGSRIRQQIFCPTATGRSSATSSCEGYEFSKDQYVQVQGRGAEGPGGRGLEDHRHRRVRAAGHVDPIYFEKTYYLGPDKGGEKAYRLLADAMEKAGQVALAKYVMRGKESLVLIRAAQNGLMLHTMYFADEVRNFDEVDKGESATIKEGELDLALQLIKVCASGVLARPQHRRLPPSRARDGQPEGRGPGDHRRRARRAARPGDRPHGGAQGEPGQADGIGSGDAGEKGRGCGSAHDQEAPGEGGEARRRAGEGREEGPGGKEVALLRLVYLASNCEVSRGEVP